MLEEIVEIGDMILGDSSDDDSYLSSLIEEIPISEDDNKRYVLKLNFSTSEKVITIDCKEEVDEGTAKKYVYVGTADGANSPQWYASAPKIVYFLTETIPNLSSMSIPNVSDLCQKVLDNYFIKDIKNYFIQSKNIPDNIKEIVKSQRVESKYECFLDIDNIDFEYVGKRERFASSIKYGSEEELKDNITNIEKILVFTHNKSKENNKIYKNFRENFVKDFEKFLESLTGLKTKQISLYVLCIDEKPLTSYKEYINAVLSNKQNTTKASEKSKKAEEGNICYLCSNKNGLSSDGFKKVKFKYFTTNLDIFAPYLSKSNYPKSVTVCSECNKKLQAADTFLRNKLSTNLGSFDIYVLPAFVYTENKLTKENMERLASQITESLNTAWNYESIEKFRDEISNFLSWFNENYYFLLNLIFYKESNAGTKIIKFIPDVNPSIFDRIYNAAFKVNKLYSDLIGYDPFFKISLKTIYNTIPIRLKKRNERAEAQKILRVYDSIFTGRKIPRDFLIENFIDAISIIAYKKEGYNISNLLKDKSGFAERELVVSINDMVFLMKFLEILNCLEVEKSMDVSQLSLPDDIKNYILQMNYDEPKTALFLLGILIGEIGAKQYQNTKSKDSESLGHKPILNKINFNGIDRAKLVRLCEDVFNKLRQEKILSYNELTFAEMKRLLDKHIDSWKLNKYETLFYILSGYSYKTKKVMLSAANSQNTSD